MSCSRMVGVPAVVRIRARLIPDGECMIYSGSKNEKGYGLIFVGTGTKRVHRLWWQAHGRTIPRGKQLDHLCGNRACVRLDHLEVVTNRTNVLRGNGPTAINARKSHCARGHAFDAENTYQSRGGRVCRRCRYRRTKESRERRWRRQK